MLIFLILNFWLVAPDKILSMGQIEMCNYAKPDCLKLTVFDI